MTDRQWFYSAVLALSAFYAVDLWLDGLGLASPIVVCSGMARIVPYLGCMSGLILAFLSALLQFHGGLLHRAWAGPVFILGPVLDSVFLTLRLVGHAIGLQPALLIVRVMAGGRLFGLMGILRTLAVSAVVMVWMRYRYYGAPDG